MKFGEIRAASRLHMAAGYAQPSVRPAPLQLSADQWDLYGARRPHLGPGCKAARAHGRSQPRIIRGPTKHLDTYRRVAPCRRRDLWRSPARQSTATQWWHNHVAEVTDISLPRRRLLFGNRGQAAPIWRRSSLQARVDPGQARTYSRLSQLMASMHQSISDTVARAAESDPDLAQRMEAATSGYLDNRAQSLAAGQSYGGTSAQAPGTQPYGAAGNLGASRQANGGFGNAAGRAGIPQTARSAAPESLVSFLTRQGGVYDDGGDLASMGAGKLRVGFLRKPPEGPIQGQGGLGGGGFGGFNSGNSRAGEPMQLDYAREKAIEAGYLPPGLDLTDFKAAIGEDLRGNRQYVPEDFGALSGAAWWRHG